VQDPSIHPWFSHPADNGFPSDHTAVAVLTSLVVLFHRRTAGLVLLALGVLIGAARVLAHVHHVQDIVAGGVIGLVAALLGALVWRVVAPSAVARRVARPTTGESASRGGRVRP
jgi:membrane-associated phospholipid phosphatase